MSKLSLNAGVPLAGIIEWPSATPPTGFLICDGSLKSTTTYAALFALIGYTYGGSGANFALPDLRGAIVVGADNMGGTAANRIGFVHPSPNTLGTLGGTETVSLSDNTMPSHGATTVYSDNPNLNHSHGMYATAAASGDNVFPIAIYFEGGYAISGPYRVGSGVETMYGLPTHTHSTEGATSTMTSAGSSTAHNNMMPTLIENAIIRCL